LDDNTKDVCDLLDQGLSNGYTVRPTVFPNRSRKDPQRNIRKAESCPMKHGGCRLCFAGSSRRAHRAPAGDDA